MDQTGRVFDIKRYAIHDGPGIRTTVFMKGCPLRCPWCHNPEGVSPAAEFMWWETRCLGCRACEQVCPQDAISFPEAAPVVDDSACDMCGACVTACYPHALEMAGSEMTAGEVLAEVERDAVFYGRSGGGVTFSGGEPLMQPEFLDELLKECKRMGIHRAVDTSGYEDREVMSSVMADVDIFLYDIKLIDEEAHKRYTGVSNRTILDNLRMLIEHDKRVAVRFSVVPGVNDSADNVDALGTFVASLGNGCEVHLLPYHRAGMEKSGRLGRSEGVETFKTPSAAMIRSIGDRLERCGLRVRVGG